MRDRSKSFHVRYLSILRRPFIGLAIVGALTLTSVTSTTAARAQGKAAATQTAQARAAELFNKGADAYRRGDFQQAVTLLVEARALDPSPVLLYNLGRAYEDLGDVNGAIATFTRYLEEDPKAGDRGAIEQRIATLTRQRDERLALEKQRDAERTRADAEKEKAENAERERKERATVVVAPRPRSVAPYIVAGVGVAGLATGVVFGLVASSKHDSASQASTTQQDAIAQQDTAKSFSTISTVSFIAGGVLVAAGATWWLIDRKASSTPGTGAVGSFRVGLAPGFLTLERGFQ